MSTPAIISRTQLPLSPTNDRSSSSYDYKSDQHNMILGAIVLFLAVAAVAIAVLQLRQGRVHHRPTNDTTTETAIDNIELDEHSPGLFSLNSVRYNIC